MTLPITIPVASGGAFVVSAAGARVLITCPEWATMTRAEAEELADALYIAGRDAEPPMSVQAGRAGGER